MMDQRLIRTSLCFVLIVCAVCAEEGLSLRQLLDQSPLSSDGPPPPSGPVPDPFYYDRNAASADSPALLNDPRFDERVSGRIAANTLDMARDIGETVLRDSIKGSEVFSPLSIYSALSLLLLGASGRTFDELMRLLHFDTDAQLAANPWKIHEDFGLLLEDVTRIGQNPSRRRAATGWKVNRGPAVPGGGSYRGEMLGDYRVAVANGLFVQNGYSLRADYRSAVLGIYRSNLQGLDFSKDAAGATRYINNWVNQKTEGKIPQIVEGELSPDTKIVMASALYFNARWEKSFFEGTTALKNFYPDGFDAAPITVEMMGNGGRFPFYESKEYDCRIIGLPYKHNTTTMYVIQPNNSSRTRLRALQSLLTADKIESMIANMQWETAIVLLPKMKITNQLNLKQVLHTMGVETLFNLHHSDLSLISNGLGADHELPSGQAFATPPRLDIPDIGAAPQRFDAALPADFHHVLPLPESEQSDEPFIFSSDDDTKSRTTTTPAAAISRQRRNAAITYKVPSEQKSAASPLNMKSFILSKRITKTKPGKKSVAGATRRVRRQIDLSQSLKQLDELRQRLRNEDAVRSGSENNGLFVDEILHQVDLTVNEKGTEGGAATVTTLFRTGTDVVMRVETPFMFLIRHDDTKLPLFYGAVFEPSN